jgi:hypothetical protein
VRPMKRSLKSHGQRCCHTARKQLLDELRKCDYCTTSVEEHDACRQAAARESGERAKACVRE